MNRKTFIKASCLACTSIGFVSTILESCVSVKYTAGQMNEDGLLVDLNEFNTAKNKTRSYIIVSHDDLKFPICVYRLKDEAYSAVLLSCSHQGAELQVSGEYLTCPAHGSEFDKQGKVMQGPANTDLRTFPVSKINNQLFIDLRKKTS